VSFRVLIPVGGPCEPTGKKTISDYVYVMQFTGDKIAT
jgi:hypothetical protein